MAVRKGPVYDKNGKQICGAKTKSKIKRDGTRRKNKICHRSPMPNNRCHIHGGKSTGPKNSVAYYRKTIMKDAPESLDIENPMDLIGELGLVRRMLGDMMENPLKVYCQDCRQWVVAEVKCPMKEYNDKMRLAEGKKSLNHHVSVRDNDYGGVVKAAKLLSDIAKNHKEIQKGKEITIRVEIINLIVSKVAEAYELAERAKTADERRRIFSEGVERLVLDSVSNEDVGELQKTRN